MGRCDSSRDLVVTSVQNPDRWRTVVRESMISEGDTSSVFVATKVMDPYWPSISICWRKDVESRSCRHQAKPSPLAASGWCTCRNALHSVVLSAAHEPLG